MSAMLRKYEKILGACSRSFFKAYRYILAPLFMSVGVQCRFEPSCSYYAEEAVKEFGLWKGMGLGLARLARCHPFCEGGHDPVPRRG